MSDSLLVGYVPTERSVKANEATEDTQFTTFESAAGGYLFLAKVDNERDARNYLDDIAVLVFRLEELRRQTEEEIRTLPATIAELKQQVEAAQKPYTFGTRLYDLDRSLVAAENRGPTLELRLARLTNAYLGFISAPGVEAELLRQKTESNLTGTKIRPAWNEGTVLCLGDMRIDLATDDPDSPPLVSSSLQPDSTGSVE